MTGRAVAAIDCGTNSTRLLVADENGRELVRLMRITRLGQGVDRNGELAPEAIARTVGVLHEFRRSMDRFDVDQVRLVATSATGVPVMPDGSTLPHGSPLGTGVARCRDQRTAPLAASRA